MRPALGTDADRIVILTGTQTGNAECIAKHAADEVRIMGLRAEVVDMADLLPEDVQQYRRVVLCSSTWGEGDVPDNAIDLLAGLREFQPDLSPVRFGVIALGDREYESSFCGGARKLQDAFTGLGARMTGARLEIDAGPAESDFVRVSCWIREFVAALPEGGVRPSIAS